MLKISLAHGTEAPGCLGDAWETPGRCLRDSSELRGGRQLSADLSETIVTRYQLPVHLIYVHVSLNWSGKMKHYGTNVEREFNLEMCSTKFLFQNPSWAGNSWPFDSFRFDSPAPMRSS